jgi:type I restriction enzyme S subunit
MNNWIYEKLSKLCLRIGDGLHGTPSYVENSGIYFINGNNLKNGRIEITDNTKCVSVEELKNNFIELNENSLLLSINGTLGSMAFYRNEKVMLGKSSAYLNFKSPINKFYYYYFQLQFVQEYFLNVATGSTIKNLSLKSIQDFEVPVPEFNVWNGIASVLSVLDSKIELNNRINTELEAMAKTLYDYWFVQFEFPDINGKPYKTNGGKMVWNEELNREIPEGWDSGVLSDLGEIIGGSTPSRDVEENFDTNGTPWITPKDLSENTGNKFITKGEVSVSEKGLKSASLKILPKGSVLMSSRAPVGYMAIARESVTTNQGFKSFVPILDYSTSFIYYTIKNAMPEIINNASGSTFKEISGSTLKIIKVCLPNDIVIKEYTTKVEAIFARQNNLEIENQKLTELRDWLLPMLMNGQVKVV